ncbi:uncharacterized protein DUF896 [Hydrogenispora ethanolica]|uniref:UPF0291 protein EDC14_100592 n=1 Tax=Hydrogenispora ethanolica TaxID=1082276 RepID=A0A4R1S3M0_HYDET|nr:DUF896 domain-containing protein [Hydrogenispora ethanolica]TCL73230.1 uncharacterized protein DUF896 [Hydrogenispora ethanolica]
MPDLKTLTARLNALYHKSQKEGLTPEELAERDQLRRQYLGMIRNQVQSSLERIRVVDAPEEHEETCDHQHCDCHHPGHRH